MSALHLLNMRKEALAQNSQHRITSWLNSLVFRSRTRAESRHMAIDAALTGMAATPVSHPRAWFVRDLMDALRATYSKETQRRKKRFVAT